MKATLASLFSALRPGAIFLLATGFPGLSMAQETALRPFWKGKVMYNESVMMISSQGGSPEAALLFKPRKILRVTNAGQNKEYKKGVDWEYRDGKLRLLPGSTAASMTENELFPDSGGRFKAVGGGFVLHQEGSFFHDRQLAVTYRHSAKAWKGPLPVYEPDKLRGTLDKLKKKEKIHVLLFGDSIAEGANSSSKSDAPPRLPTWGELFAGKLRSYYQADVVFTNTAVGGKDTRWGKKEAPNAVVAHKPDLVVIAFGMNDGTGKMAPADFRRNISEIMQQAKDANPSIEFLLVAPMLPNPRSFFTGTQREFRKELESLTGPGCALVDLTSVHEELLKHKSYQDLTGNNINHPNDFLVRWYAQFLIGSLISPDKM